MTLIVAVIFDPKESAVLAADRRVLIRDYLANTSKPGEGDKLFSIGGCAVASYGTGPKNVSVPDSLRSLGSRAASPSEIANKFAALAMTFPDPGDFGVLFLGSGARELELWERASDGSVWRIDIRSGDVIFRGQEVNAPRQAQLSRPEHAEELALSILRQASVQSSAVGPPFDFAILQWGDGMLQRREPK